jgi:hypothetical protein
MGSNRLLPRKIQTAIPEEPTNVYSKTNGFRISTLIKKVITDIMERIVFWHLCRKIFFPERKMSSINSVSECLLCVRC